MKHKIAAISALALTLTGCVSPQSEAAPIFVAQTAIHVKQLNKEEHWNKLDKTVKLQKLKKFVDQYSKDNNLNLQQIK